MAIACQLLIPPALQGRGFELEQLERDDVLDADVAFVILPIFAFANAGLSIFQGHGTYDPMVPIERGEAARDRLIELGLVLFGVTLALQWAARWWLRRTARKLGAVR